MVSAAVPACCLEGVRRSAAGGRWGQHLALGTNLLVDAFLQDRAWCARITRMARKALGWPKRRKWAYAFPWQYRAIKCLSWPKFFWANVASFSRLSSGYRLGGTAARRRRNKPATRCRVYVLWTASSVYASKRPGATSWWRCCARAGRACSPGRERQRAPGGALAPLGYSLAAFQSLA